MHFQPADEKWESHSHTTIFSMPCHLHVPISFKMWAPLINSKGCWGSCEPKYFTGSLTLVKFLLKDTSAEHCLNAPPGWMCKQRRLCSGSRCCERLLEGTAALANTELALCTKARRSMQISYCGKGPHRSEVAVAEPTAFHSWSTLTP